VLVLPIEPYLLGEIDRCGACGVRKGVRASEKSEGCEGRLWSLVGICRGDNGGPLSCTDAMYVARLALRGSCGSSNDRSISVCLAISLCIIETDSVNECSRTEGKFTYHLCEFALQC
jgi:hypothetical protein